MSMPSEEITPPASAADGVQGYAGRYSDGRTAATRRVALGVGNNGLHIVHVATGETLVWPYSGLSTAQPLSTKSADVLIRSATESGATVFVSSPAFSAELVARAPHLTARAERMRYLLPALGVVAVVAFLGALIYLLDWSPSRAIARVVPSVTWNAAGRQLASGFEKDYPGCDDIKGRAALDKLLKRLVDASPDQQGIHLHVANWALVNAFALPGRHLMLTRGLIRDSTSPEEVAGVLGHEMGHAIELHPEAGIVRQLGLAVGLKLIFAGTSDSLQNLGGLLLILRYTREAERRADEWAFDLLYKSRISAKPLGVFFERMAKKEGEAPSNGKLSKAAEIFSTHPALRERAANAATRPDYPTEPIMTPEEWQALRGMCKVTPPKPAAGGKGAEAKGASPPKE